MLTGSNRFGLFLLIGVLLGLLEYGLVGALWGTVFGVAAWVVVEMVLSDPAGMTRLDVASDGVEVAPGLWAFPCPQNPPVAEPADDGRSGTSLRNRKKKRATLRNPGAGVRTGLVAEVCFTKK